MSTQWLRLWHDMPNDPKWRTISRVSKQPITAVISVYVHLLVIASNANERGQTKDARSEDIASALDLDVEQVDAVMAAMQGRVIEGDLISGWGKRQVEREDGSAERAKAWRNAQKEGKQTQSNAEETQPNATERKKTPDTDTEVNLKPPSLRDVPLLGSPKPKAKGQTLLAWLADAKAKGEKAVSGYEPLWAFCEKSGLPTEWIEIAWAKFVERYSLDEKGRVKRYADWRRVFLRAVEENWLNLWFWSDKDGQYRLTTVGFGADRATREAA
jgi:hypothetical protein